MQLEVTKGTICELNEIEELYNALNDVLANGINYPGWKKGIYPIREDALKGIEENNLFVAKHNNKIVGTIILNHEPANGYENVNWNIKADYNKIIVIHTFAVHPDYLKNKIGMALMKFAEEEAKRCNMKCIRLDVYEKNVPAIKLYEKMGYEYIDTIDLGLGLYGLDWFKVYEKII